MLVGLWMMRPSELRFHPPSPRGKGQVRAGFRYVRGVPELFVSLMMMAIVGTFAFNFQTVMPLLVKRTLSGDDTTFTLIYSAISVGSLAGALLAARRRAVTVRNIAVAAAGFGFAMALLAGTPNIVWSYPIGVAVGVSSIAFMTTSTTIVQVRKDPSMRGRVLALQAIVFLGSTPIGGPIVGWISERFGPRFGVLVGAVAAVAAGLYGWRATTAAPAPAAPRPLV